LKNTGIAPVFIYSDSENTRDMGRYTTVQTFSDQDANNVAISYASETASINIDASNTTANQDRDSSKKEDKFQVNRVENVSGSSAGAGSGDFHMYRSSRRRYVLKNID
jgi:hypothetical protein